MKTITILSGKGGVGKSSITASLAVLLAENKQIVAVDCDVDAPNLALVLGVKEFSKEETISTNEKAFVNENAKKCKNIVDICAFSAISWNKEKGIPEINKYLCEGCGACQLLCPDGIDLKEVENAVIGEAETCYGFPLVSGQLKMGESGSGKVVDVVKEKARKYDAEIMIVDSAAGIGCPVIASVRDSDFVVGVTEPTPSALSDLKRGLQVVNYFGIQHGIVINKYDLNVEFSEKVEQFAKQNGIPLLGKIPYNRDFVRALVEMTPIIKLYPKYRKMFEDLLSQIVKGSNLLSKHLQLR